MVAHPSLQLSAGVWERASHCLALGLLGFQKDITFMKALLRPKGSLCKLLLKEKGFKMKLSDSKTNMYENA